ncbi:MAG: indole-3-glycerol phosphate synthase TrpC [Gammaproteobacteria bacterium]|nr:MAG: indole-3-glycerol phosphate synthase TrpC [Gammaproteobacteria bacterium]
MNKKPNILKKIIIRKNEEIRVRSMKISEQNLIDCIKHADPCRGFTTTLTEVAKSGDPAIIAEIKKGSPSKGVIRENFSPEQIAVSYEQAGAACLSVLTDRDFFFGCEDYLLAARKQVSIPVIRKDFIIDPYQVFEARAINADSILLIVSALDDPLMKDLNDLAIEIGMDVLIETHDPYEMERALKLGPRLVGINNRDLRTFETDLNTTIDMIKEVPDSCSLVTESGIHTKEDVALMRDNNVNCFLVGEAFMRADDPGSKLKELFF